LVGTITDRGAIEVFGKNTALLGVDLDDSVVVVGSGIQFGIPQYDNVSVVLHNGQTATYYTGAEDSETYISEIDYETYNFTTDLEINDIGGGDISWSYTNVTMSVATGHTSRTLEVTKGFVTGM
jgi:hypothetical protein